MRCREGSNSPFVAAISLIGLIPVLAGCSGSGSAAVQNPSGSTRVQQVNLVSDLAGVAAKRDVNLVNPWGIAYRPTGPFWIADNNSGKSTLYDGSGVAQPLIVNIAAPAASTGGTATGQVYNGTPDFKLGDGNPALFIFSTEDGAIVAWSGYTVTNAVVTADRSAIPDAANGAVYKGLAIGSNAAGNFLYATNFRAGTIDVFDTNFKIVKLTGSFTDPAVPAGFAPFGIQNFGGNIYVTYAKQDAAKHDDVAGAGGGLIDVFDTNGNFTQRFASGTAAGGASPALNSPWGMAVAPASFGAFGNALLVGNFGDGRITAFNLSTGAVIGQLQNSAGTGAVAIPGLWGLIFGNGGQAGSASVLYFTAGIGDPPSFTNNTEQHGLFGSLTSTGP